MRVRGIRRMARSVSSSAVAILIGPLFSRGAPSCQQPQLLVNVSVVCHEGQIRVAERFPGARVIAGKGHANKMVSVE